MPRGARIVIPGLAHHVTQRGNNRHDVFFTDDDYRLYLAFLKDQADRFDFRVFGYCLMTNHVHLIGIPEDDRSLAKTIGRTHFCYSQTINRLHGRSGHLWQGRFYSCGLDEDHLWEALCYVERNPVRAGMAEQAWEWPWSSVRAHVEGFCNHNEMDRYHETKSQSTTSGLLDMEWFRTRRDPTIWKQRLTKPEDENILTNLRTGTTRGRPLASDSFLSKLETKLNRRLRPKPRGRPRKKEA